MNDNKSVKVLGVGSPILDILASVDDAFINAIEGDKGGMELVSSDRLTDILSKTNGELSQVPGGSAANTIFGLATLGVETRFLGKLGKDQDGEFYKNRYANSGGDTIAFSYSETAHTGRCLSLVTPDSERTMRTDLGAAAEITIENVSSKDFVDISHVHIEGYMLFNEAVTRHILKLAKESKCTVSLDLASFEVVNATKTILPELLSEYVNIVFANEDEAKAFCGDDSPEKALEVLSEYCETVVAKLGKDGCYIKSGNETVKVDAEIVEAIDTTGAGDLWQTGFLYGFLNGKTLKESGTYGSILGAEVVQVMGAAIPDPRWNVIKQKIK